MIATVKHNSRNYKIDLSKPLDISIPLMGGYDNVNAWYLGPPKIEPHIEGNFVGKISEGASTNFNDIWFNPHSHVTHTECLGHITEGFHSVNQKLKRFFFLTEVITVAPEQSGQDFVISEKQLKYALGNKKREAVVVRTLPNLIDKKSKDHSNTNPPYFMEDSIKYLVKKDVEHLLVDLPSVDKEKDQGALSAHKAFWNLTEKPRMQATITELVYVPNNILDGTYFLNLQVAPFENDASPSRPVLFQIME